MRTFLDYSDVGAKFVFGENFKDHFIAFKVLPTIIFFASFIAILYHDGISPRIVSIISQIMMRTMKISGAETLSCASNMFVGCTEAPLMIKPYINTLTLSELHAIMTGGFATIAGGVMAAYIAMGISPTHLISASVMSAPAALAISKIMYPETDQSETKNEVIIELKSPYTNAIDAAINGALEGLKLALNVGAMLIAILGLVAFINGILVAIGQP